VLIKQQFVNFNLYLGIKMNRKKFIQTTGWALAAMGMPGFLTGCSSTDKSVKDLFFDISLAQWSLHRNLFDGDLTHLDFPATAKNEFGITAVEYVNQFFADKAKDKSYLDKMNTRCNDLGVDQVLIMIDGEGSLAVTDDLKRQEAVENHYKWVEAAEYLGCHCIRVNTYGDGTPQSQKMAAVDSLGQLSKFAQDFGINIIVENHGGYSSNAQWLVDVMQQVDMDNCGTLPDFGNFCIEQAEDGSCAEAYDRYQGVEEMMPFAKGVSAKSYAFDEQGEETSIDFGKMLKIVQDAGYTGHIGIEYEGDELSEFEGIKATKNVLMEVGSQLTAG